MVLLRRERKKGKRREKERKSEVQGELGKLVMGSIRNGVAPFLKDVGESFNGG